MLARIFKRVQQVSADGYLTAMAAWLVMVALRLILGAALLADYLMNNDFESYMHMALASLHRLWQLISTFDLISMALHLPWIFRWIDDITIHARRKLIKYWARYQRFGHFGRPIVVASPQDAQDEPKDKHRGEKFRYSPLDVPDQEIRLLYLLPQDDSDTVRLSLLHASMYERPQYFALSYVWGAVEPSETVLINGYPFQVGPNLFSALSHLRHFQGKNRGIPFWIDALCINQSDTEERNKQLCLMKMIYETAFKVLVWLGPPSSDTELALAKLKALEAYLVNGFAATACDSKTQSRHPYTDSDVPWHRELLYVDTIIVGDPRDASTYLGPWEAIITLLNNPWFKRAWVAQEVSAPASSTAGNVEILLGRALQTVSLRSTLTVVCLIVTLSKNNARFLDWPEAIDLFDRAEKGFSAISRLIRTSQLRRELTMLELVSIYIGSCFRQRSMTLLSSESLWAEKVAPMLNLFSESRTSDARDLVYCAYALTLGYSHPAFRPDYSRSVKEVYGQVVQSFIKYQMDLTILSRCSGPGRDLPSWIPDWRSPSKTLLMGGLRDVRGKPIYNSSGVLSPDADIDIENGILNISGIFIDTVTFLCSRQDRDRKCHAVCQVEWKGSRLKVPPERYEQTGENTSTARARTLRADILNEFSFNGFGSRATWFQKIYATLVIILYDSFTWPWPSQHDEVLEGLVNSLLGNRRLGRMVYERGDQVNVPSGHITPQVNGSWSATLARANNEESDRCIDACVCHSFCLTSHGYMGLVPRQTRVGDIVAILLGGRTPFVLRPVTAISGSVLVSEGQGDGSHLRYELIGECYLHGFMDGEILKDLGKGQAEIRKFVLQ